MNPNVLQQLLSRLLSGKPAFFQKVQTFALIIISICTFLIMVIFPNIHIAANIVAIVKGTIMFFSGVAITAQTPNKDVNQQQ